MKDPRFVQDYLRDILEAMDKAEEFISGLDIHTFARDDKSAFAVIRCLEIIKQHYSAFQTIVAWEATYLGLSGLSMQL